MAITKATSLLSKSIPNLLGGVSQQPDAIRFDNQCSIQDNGFPSVLDGLIKRPPTEHITQLDSSAPGNSEDYFSHIINLNATDQYVLLIKADETATDPTLVIKKLSDGSAVTIHDSEALRDYLNLASSSYSAEKDLRAITIADYTFLINRSKTVALTSDTDTARNPEGLLYVKTGDYGTTYTAIITIGGVEYKTEVTTPSGTQVKVFDSEGYVIYGTFDSRDSIDTANIAKAFMTGEAIGFNNHISGLFTNEDGGQDGGTIKEYLDGVLITPAVVVPAFRGDTNDSITFTKGTPDTIVESGEGTENFNSISDTDTILVVGSSIAANNGVHTVDTRIGSTLSLTTNNSVVSTESDEYVSVSVIESGTVTNTTHGIRHAAGITKASEGSVIHIQSNDTTDFTLSSTDGLGETALINIKSETEKLTELPTVAPHNFFVKILGQADESVDDYYVKFKADNTSFGTGSWEETRLHGIKYKLDSATLPHALIKLPNGDFRFTKLDGSSITVDAVAYTAPIWAERLTGDLDTNPNPTFIGRTINDIFIFKNRLGFLSDENVVLSETSEFFNFFRTTVLDLPETAPIDVASTHSRVSILTSAVPFARQLILFSDATQFILGSGNASLTPETVSITKTTSYDSVLDVKPISLGSSIYFGFTRGDFSGLRQYLRSNDTETVFDAEDISSQAPQYIKGSLRQIAGSTHEDVIFLTTDTDRNNLYCYKFYDKPNADRIQSAWSRFVFSANDSASTADILGISFVDASLYLVMKRADGIYLDRMRLESGLVDSGSTYRTLLDRRVTNATTGVSLSGGGKTITLPYKVYDNDNSPIQVIKADGDRVTVSTQTDDSAAIVVTEDLSGVDFFAGEAYTMTYEFSDVVLRESTLTNETALISQGRKQIRYLSLDYHDTSFFKVTVTLDHRDYTSSYFFTGRILGEASLVLNTVPLDSGVYRVPIYSKADQVTIQILNDSPLPCAITSAEFEMLFHARSNRYS
jgi:hypothetical protein